MRNGAEGLKGLLLDDLDGPKARPLGMLSGDFQCAAVIGISHSLVDTVIGRAWSKVSALRSV